jgi:tetratricopeptide (TPR) repeat protein
MATNRIEILKTLLAQNPTDSFARYGLAMEYANAGELERAVEEYRAVIASNENYAAAYFHGGQALEKMGRLEECREFYEKGIAVTRRSGDQHTLAELQAALEMLPI